MPELQQNEATIYYVKNVDIRLEKKFDKFIEPFQSPDSMGYTEERYNFLRSLNVSLSMALSLKDKGLITDTEFTRIENEVWQLARKEITGNNLFEDGR